MEQTICYAWMESPVGGLLLGADDRGLRVGDLILSVQMVQVKAPAEVTQQFEGVRQQGKQYVLVLIWNANATKSVALPLSNGAGQPEQAAPH